MKPFFVCACAGALALFSFSTAAAESASSAAGTVAQLFGASLDWPVQVLLDDGTPAAGARLSWCSRSPWTHDSVRIETVADSNGTARLQGLSFGLSGKDFGGPAGAVRLLVAAPEGYAQIFEPQAALEADGSLRVVVPPDPADGPASRSIRLLAHRAPHPMAVSAFGASGWPPAVKDLPDGPLGYDAAKGAFLPPVGEGETADFTVEAGGSGDLRWFVFRPAAPGGAFAEVPRTAGELVSPRTAETDAWSAEPLRFSWGAFAAAEFDEAVPRSLRQVEGERRGADAAKRAMVPPGSSVFLFRSRARLGAAGAVESAHYGVFYFGGWLALGNGDPVRVRFNTEPDVLNLEPETVDNGTGDPLRMILL